MPSFYLGQPVT
jgi:hypothetical protein